MGKYDVLIKTVDGNQHKFEFENTTSQNVYWKIFENEDGIIEYEKEESVLYLRSDKIVSAEIINVEARTEREKQQHDENMKALQNFKF